MACGTSDVGPHEHGRAALGCDRERAGRCQERACLEAQRVHEGRERVQIGRKAGIRGAEGGVGTALSYESSAGLELTNREFEVLDFVAVGAPVQGPRFLCSPEARRVPAAAAREEPRPPVVLALEVTGRAAHPPLLGQLSFSARKEQELPALEQCRQGTGREWDALDLPLEGEIHDRDITGERVHHEGARAVRAHDDRSRSITHIDVGDLAPGGEADDREIAAAQVRHVPARAVRRERHVEGHVHRVLAEGEVHALRGHGLQRGGIERRDERKDRGIEEQAAVGRVGAHVRHIGQAGQRMDGDLLRHVAVGAGRDDAEHRPPHRIDHRDVTGEEVGDQEPPRIRGQREALRACSDRDLGDHAPEADVHDLDPIECGGGNVDQVPVGIGHHTVRYGTDRNARGHGQCPHRR